METANGSTSVAFPADHEIIEHVRRGDVQAYGILVERYERGVLAAVLPIVRDMHAAQDVTQDVFVKCYIKLSALRDGSRFGYWLMKIARREAVNAARRLKRMQAAQMRAVEADLPADATALDDDHQHLLDSVRKLPIHERLIVSLRYFDGHNVKEISRMTGRPVGTVTKQLSRAIERLRGDFSVENQPCQMKRSTVN